jgi:hypothetical protein
MDFKLRRKNITADGRKRRAVVHPAIIAAAYRPKMLVCVNFQGGLPREGTGTDPIALRCSTSKLLLRSPDGWRPDAVTLFR